MLVCTLVVKHLLTGRRCLPQAVQAAAEADVALLVVSAKGREMEAALREAEGNFRGDKPVLDPFVLSIFQVQCLARFY